MSEYVLDGRPATWDEVLADMKAKSTVKDMGEGILILAGGSSVRDYLTPEAIANRQAARRQALETELEHHEAAARGDGAFFDITYEFESLKGGVGQMPTTLEYRAVDNLPEVGQEWIEERPGIMTVASFRLTDAERVQEAQQRAQAELADPIVTI